MGNVTQHGQRQRPNKGEVRPRLRQAFTAPDTATFSLPPLFPCPLKQQEEGGSQDGKSIGSERRDRGKPCWHEGREGEAARPPDDTVTGQQFRSTGSGGARHLPTGLSRPPAEARDLIDWLISLGCFTPLPQDLRTSGTHRDEDADRLLLLAGCLTSQQQASVSQGRICSDNFTCCHTEIEVADQTFYLTQSQYTDTGPTSPSADPITPGVWQGSHWSANF